MIKDDPNYREVKIGEWTLKSSAIVKGTQFWDIKGELQFHIPVDLTMDTGIVNTVLASEFIKIYGLGCRRGIKAGKKAKEFQIREALGFHPEDLDC